MLFALEVLGAAASALLYRALLRRSPSLLAARAPASAPRPWRARAAALRDAACAVRVPAACQALCFGVTLAAWPSVPGAACAEGGFERMGQGWWFTLVIAVYNVLDFLSRLNLRRLQSIAARLSPRACLSACAARIPLVAIIYACASPRLRAGPFAGAAGNAIILVATAALALSNGVLATASMMQVARLSPPGLEEECVQVAITWGYTLGSRPVLASAGPWPAASRWMARLPDFCLGASPGIRIQFA